MATIHELYGSCSCERNQYVVAIPTASTSLAQVFFDNSVAQRRSQATPVTAWLRVPLDFYHSSTYAFFPDETHATIKRTFDTPSSRLGAAPTRRQFCGYCGTHLTAWEETPHEPDRSADFVNVTLGSLLSDSLEKLESLNIHSDTEDEDNESGLVKADAAHIDDDSHIPTNEQSMGGVDGPAPLSTQSAAPLRSVTTHRMQGRGMPYFEDMVENSRLGRIRRRKGGHTSADGSKTVQWEVVEIHGDDEPIMESNAASTEHSSKRSRLEL